MPRLLFTIACSVVLLGSGDAFAVKVNAYTFNDATAGIGGITDSVGGLHGTLVDPAGTFGVIAGGQLDLTRNNGLSSNQATELDNTAFTQGAYVDLPNGILNSALEGGTALEATIETWFTTEENRTWARVWDFGNSNLGEDTATSAGSSDYLALVPQSGSTNAGVSIEANAAERLFDTPTVTASGSRLLPEISDDDPAAPAPLSVGEEHHVVVSFSQNDLSAGIGGTIRFYLNGAEVGVGPLPDTMQLDDFSNITGDPFAIPAVPDRGPDNNWIGRSQWANALFDGHINELNIYNTALDATAVSNSFVAGALDFDSPTVYIDRDTGEITLVNETGSSQELSLVTITSGMETLEPGALAAPSEFELQTPATSGLINLADTDATGVDVPTDGTPVSLGAIWQRSPFEDVELAFELVGSDSGLAEIVYTGDEVARSDFDVDGDIDLDDYAVFVANAGRDVSSLSGIEGYFFGDIDLSGTVDRDDFRLFKSDFFAVGGTAEALASFAVPEPAGALLAMCGFACFAATRRS